MCSGYLLCYSSPAGDQARHLNGGQRVPAAASLCAWSPEVLAGRSTGAAPLLSVLPIDRCPTPLVLRALLGSSA